MAVPTGDDGETGLCPSKSSLKRRQAVTDMTNCPLRHCLPFFLVVMEPPCFQLGTSAQSKDCLSRSPLQLSVATWPKGGEQEWCVQLLNCTLPSPFPPSCSLELKTGGDHVGSCRRGHPPGTGEQKGKRSPECHRVKPSDQL